MQIKIKPQFVTSQEGWTAKMQGVVLVQKQEDIEPIWEAFCEQDDYWESYKNLFKVAPEEVNGPRDLEKMCEYCGKTDIYDYEKLKNKLLEQGLEFILFQYQEED